MRDLEQIGILYNEKCDEIDNLKSSKKNKTKSEKNEIIKEIKKKKEELKCFYNQLNDEEKKVYKEYRNIRFDIKKCEYLKKFDKYENRFFKRFNPAYIYMIPAAFGAIFFTILPFIFMVIGSCFKINITSLKDSVFKGFWNYEMIFTRDSEFKQAIVNTIIFAFFTVILLISPI